VYQEAGVIPLSSQFNTLVQGLSIASITPQQILAAGSPIFLDIRTSADINSINTLIQSYARIHSPAYGQPIAGSGLSTSRTGGGTVISPTGNEVRRIMGVNYANSGAAPVELDLGLGGVVIQSAVSVAPGETLVATLPSTIFCDSESHLYVNVLSGDPLLLVTSVASMLTSQ
jgi:hypothetical protein